MCALTLETFHGEAEDGGEQKKDECEEGGGSAHDAEPNKVEGETDSC